jgi:hypoxanthine-DNA glycosylase
MSQLKSCLPPIIDANARLLILGTLPGDESLRRQMYYGHPRNDFWPVMAAAFGEPLQEDYVQRVAMMSRKRVALWDVVASAERAGSLDSAIQKPAANDFAKLFEAYPALQRIAFNGQKAHALYRRYVLRSKSPPLKALPIAILPSTSPAHVRDLAEKTKLWRNAIHAALAA